MYQKTTSSNSSLQTMEQSFKKTMTISKLIIHKKVIPENIIYLLEVNKKMIKKHYVSNYSNSISSDDSLNEDININEEFDKSQLYLEDLCDSFKNKYT